MKCKVKIGRFCVQFYLTVMTVYLVGTFYDALYSRSDMAPLGWLYCGYFYLIFVLINLMFLKPIYSDIPWGKINLILLIIMLTMFISKRFQ